MKTDQIYSNRVTTCVLEGVREIIGPEELANAVAKSDMDQLMSPEETTLRLSAIRALHSIFLNRFGSLPVQGIARQSGRSFFNYFLKFYGKEAGFEELEFRLLPPRQRILAGLKSLAQVVGRECHCPVDVSEQESKWVWKMNYLPGIEKGGKDQCQFTQGVLQGYLTWISGGKYYPVEECNEAIEGQTAFVIEIAQQPID